MTEAVIAVNDFWFDTLGFQTLRAPKAVANAASRRISEKTGMRLVGFAERDYVSGRLPGEVWELTAEEWRGHRATVMSALLRQQPIAGPGEQTATIMEDSRGSCSRSRSTP